MHHGIKKLLLLGAGHAHVHVLASLAQHRPADLDVTVLTPFAYQTYSGMTPGFVAGHYSETECRIELEPLVRGVAIDAARECIVGEEPDIAAALNCPVGAPLLRIDRVYRDGNGRPVELAVSYFLPDLYSYRVQLRRNSP